MNILRVATAIVLIGLVPSMASASVTFFNNRTAFTIATGIDIVEDFGSNYAFPIPSGVLNSNTPACCAYGTIAPGTINPGVTYSTPVVAGTFFNIDSQGGFTGGFLDSVVGPKTLTVTFDEAQPAFGFDANALMYVFNVTINDAGGQIYSNNFPAAGFQLPPQFFGFTSTTRIVSLTIGSLNMAPAGIGFAIDNFTYYSSSALSALSAAPEPGTWIMLPTGFGSIGIAMRRYRSVAA